MHNLEPHNLVNTLKIEFDHTLEGQPKRALGKALQALNRLVSFLFSKNSGSFNPPTFHHKLNSFI
ncbi:hypothetical protein HanIR_Chr12g0588931 [Helianthus annuus]|nr:hypothetical protein HanIR_Chr12g0588931 [Helianthus annuus]